MRYLYAVLALVVICLTSMVYAHSNLVSSVPEDGAQINEASEIQLVFSAPVKLVTMKLVNTAGAEIALGTIPADMMDAHTITIGDVLAPFRKKDAEEALKLINPTQFDQLHMAFYKNKDLGNDGVWDVWQIEGPSALIFFRGEPHVHAYVHIRDKPLA